MQTLLGRVHSQSPRRLLPIDLTSRVMLNFDLLENCRMAIPAGVRCCGGFLPGAFRAYRQQLGVEGITCTMRSRLCRAPSRSYSRPSG